MEPNTHPDAPSGILLIHKPEGVTSHDAVSQIRKLYHTKKVGHTGTLDPMATGLLTVLVGRAVKASEFAMSSSKRYIATLKLGLTTDTEDITGTVLTTASSLPSKEALASVLPRFQGEILQTPPMVSAIKIGGKKLVDLARKGIEVERQPRPITIYRLTAEPIDPQSGTYRLDITCSKGTYIRTLCADIGNALGCGGVMASLCRVENGMHALSDAHTLEEIEAMDEAARALLLRPTEEVFASHPTLHLPAFFARLAHAGNPIFLHKLPSGALRAPDAAPLSIESAKPGDLIRLYDQNGFFALAQVTPFAEGLAAKPIRAFG